MACLVPSGLRLYVSLFISIVIFSLSICTFIGIILRLTEVTKW